MQFFRRFSFLASVTLLLLGAFICFSLPSSAAEKKKFTVVIDAGHGGNDHGAIENGVNEKDVNLAVALKLGNMIRKKLKDTEVIYTRSTDEFISLQKRADIANKSKGDIFVSIHCNSVDRSNKNRANVVGATTYVLGHHKDNDNLAVAKRENSVVELDDNDAAHFSNFDPSSDESNIIFQMTQKKNFQNSIRLATDVQREMASAGRVSRGVQQAGFWVLWSTAMPAVLVELDFLCNPEQAKFMGSDEGQDKLAGAIFNAIKKYETYYRISLGQANKEGGSEKDSKSTKEGKQKNAGSKKTEEPSGELASLSSVSDNVTKEPEEITADNAVELPSGDSERGKRVHRTDNAGQKKLPSGGSHRRRSSKAREAGASQIEEVQIAMVEELNPGSVDIDGSSEAVAEKTKDAGKKNKKETDKQKKGKDKKEISKPGRRDKDKQASRKGVRKSVNIDYRILLFVSDEELLANDEAFKGLSPVATFRENNKYKYTYGESADRREMELLMIEISALFPEARVIKCYY